MENANYNLQRFIDAQEPNYATALQEIKNGLKLSHWIWYVFPQLKGLGHSYNSNYYGLDDIKEAKAYFNNPVLQQRLIEITEALLEHEDKSADEILSRIDARKVKSCATLFFNATNHPVFKKVLVQFYNGESCQRTLSLIR